MKVISKLLATDTEHLLIAKGYATMTAKGFWFERYYTEAEKEQNLKTAQSMTEEEWSEKCKEIACGFDKILCEIREFFASRYDIHQINAEKSTRNHFSSDWDLFYVSTRDTSDYITTFSLSFNSKRDAERNLSLEGEILNLLRTLSYENICCYVIYEATTDTEKIKKELEHIEHAGLNHVTYNGRLGRICLVGTATQTNENVYGFYPHRCRKPRHLFKDKDILAMLLGGQIKSHCA